MYREISRTLPRFKPLWLLRLLLFLISVYEGNPANSREDELVQCGAWLKEPFVLYETRVRISEYDFFDKPLARSKQVSSVVSSDAEPTRYIGLKSHLVLDLDVRENDNIHMRVMDFFLDVYGFNVTYEVIDKQKDGRTDSCIDSHCSFNGICYATADFKTYTCTCLQPYYGDDCTYSPVCGPHSNDTMCLNGGFCRHYIGSRARKCECPLGYEGVFCERRQQKVHSMDGSKFLKCENTPNGTQVCTCPPRKQLADDSEHCIVRETVRYVMSFKILSPTVEYTYSNTDLQTWSPVTSMELKRHLQTALVSLLQPGLSTLKNLLVLSINDVEVVQFHFFGEKRESENVKTLMEKVVRNGEISGYRVDPHYFQFERKPSLNILSLKTSEKLPVTVGSQLTLECIVSGSSKMEVTWYKDGFPINKNVSHQRMWTAVVPKNSQDQFTHLLGFDSTDILDAGVFTCEVVEWGIIKRMNKQIYTRGLPRPKLIPLTATVVEGDNIELRCLLQEDASEKFGYIWLRNGKTLNPSKEPEIIEDLFRTGSRLVIRSINSSATYTCIVTSSAGKTSRKSIITVLKSKDFPVCPAQHFEGLTWKITAGNSEHKFHCPRGFRGGHFCV
ncbi:uncharacterized protein LOC143241747 [Tachypleus tridentatus]|uniref:uncharacterized protein LOC143241747 n=1 Tax=Tachypleus tridentatus TaxID=6853 RepID=UPI003FD6A475